MKKKLDKNVKVLGYIEGYYGHLLSWENRIRIINSLNRNKMNTYFYAPKEDIFHRLNWRENYKIDWRKSFYDFCYYSKTKNINVIAGIAPGLDFDFRSLNKSYKGKKNSDLDLIYRKAYNLIEDGASSIALLLDDIPNNFISNFGTDISEGTSHGILANMLSERIDIPIYFVPRIYADELINEEPNYLNDLSNILNPEVNVFYCGKNVVSKTLFKYSYIKKLFKNKIIFWDNYYANDYCPRRLFIGPYIGRTMIENIMINPTGLINTDLLILDIIRNTQNEKSSINDWYKILNDHGVPKNFEHIKQFFFKPSFTSENLPPFPEINKDIFSAIDFLLWKWKSDLSREWYPYIFGLKHDLQIMKNILTTDRILKTQTLPLSTHLQKGKIL